MDKKLKLIINVAYYSILAVLIYLGIKYCLPVIMPFVLAAIVAIIMKKPGAYIHRKTKISEKPIRILLTVLFYLFLAGILMLIGGKALSAAGNGIMQLPVLYREQILPFLNGFSDSVGEFFANIDPDIKNNIELVFAQITNTAYDFISSISVSAVKMISSFAASVPSLLIKFIVMIISSFFIAGDYENIVAFIRKWLPEKTVDTLNYVKSQIGKTVFIFIRSYAIILGITFTELVIGFSLMRLEGAILLAVLIAIFDILPVLGVGGILIPWAIAEAVLGDYPLMIGILLLYLFITIIRNTLEPRLVGKQIGLHPLITLISMLVGAHLFGIIGLFGLPLTISMLVSLNKSGGITLYSRFKEKEEEAEDIEEKEEK